MHMDQLGADLFLFWGEPCDSGSQAALAGEEALLVDGMASIGLRERSSSIGASARAFEVAGLVAVAG
jgi:hypothetical protein